MRGLEADESHVQSTTMDLGHGGSYLLLARRLPSSHFYYKSVFCPAVLQ